MSNNKKAIIIGNSDGIGFGLTKRLLKLGWIVQGFSRSASSIKNENYIHTIIDVTSMEFPQKLSEIEGDTALCVYCAAIGEELDLENLQQEDKIFQVNLNGAVKTIASILPMMTKRKKGQIIVLSSIGDIVISPGAPSYHASKAGLSSYVESMALAARPFNVAITNVRFGFVDTKMAKGSDHVPFMMSVEKSVDYIMHCIKKRPIRFTRPKKMAFLALLHRWFTRLKM
ncbi:MAG: SDR family NAD(P)-dependent oxidoreductase [candidate division Zixibacteria bacterium]|nr:SDR family NAD(P)-dependent oxidoreductase [candidate division Zixibacteria bacterium]